MKQKETVRVSTSESARIAQQKEANEFLRKPYFYIYAFIVLIILISIIFGQDSKPYGIMTITVMILALIISYLVYRKDHSSSRVKYVDFICFLVVYSVHLFLGSHIIAFAYIFPVIGFALLYFDRNYLRFVCGMHLSVQLVYFLTALVSNSSLKQGNITDNILVLAVNALFVYGIIENGKQAKAFNEIAGTVIGEKMSEIDKIIKEMLQVTKSVEEEAYKVGDIMEELDRSTQVVTYAIEDISKGVQSTAESIQTQTIMTQTMQKEIETTSDISNKVVAIAKESDEAVKSGLKLVDKLSAESDIMTEKNNNVVRTMESLQEKTKEVQQIINIILEISSQINLLSLNATIESARAGEAGRGFAVVANEIRVLADKTKASSESIDNILTQLNENANQTADLVKSSVETADSQKKLIESAEKDFHQIHQQVEKLIDSIGKINLSINHIMSSNNEIVDSIHQIAATDEQISANAVEAASLSQENLSRTMMVSNLIKDLVNTAKGLEKFQ